MERFVVGTVLLLAGAFKLAHRAWPRAAADFGAPRWVIGVLPWVELALGALLLARVGGRWTAGAACALLALFTLAVAVQLRLGKSAPCGCFGETSPEPVGADTLVRNVILTLVAALGVARHGDAGPLSMVAGVGIGLLIVAASRMRVGAGRWSGGRR